MTTPKLACLVLAAGKGTRMRSDRPKVLHPLAGRPMVAHVLDALAPLDPDRVAVVVGPGMDAVAAAVAPHRTVVQERQLGTGDAVRAARPVLEDFD
ncbi:MAG TPA: NTP transferase domain-containing protein, partial [Thalassobaculum sp.]